MRVHELTREQWVARPKNRLLPLFAEPESLAMIAPRDHRFRLRTPRPVNMAEESLIGYLTRVMSLPASRPRLGRNSACRREVFASLFGAPASAQSKRAGT